MKKLMILGASILQLPAIRRAKELGYYVGVVDYNANAVGIPYADKYFKLSTNDIDGVVSTAKEFQPNGIMTLATDMPVRSVAVATAQLGLPGISYETAVKSTDKGEMIKAFSINKVDIPWFFIVSDNTELNRVSGSVKYPCILKPVDNAGSRGVTLVNGPNELSKAYEYSRSNSRNGVVIIEEYMHGNEVSVEIICINGEVNILAVTDKLTTGAPFFVEMGHSQQSQLSSGDIRRIKILAEKAVKTVGIKNGPAHVEIMLTSNGPKLVELGARMGGDCITSHLVPLSTGIDMIEATICLACNENIDIKPKYQKGSAIRYISSGSGKIINIRGIEDASKIDGIREIILTKKIGDYVTEVNSSSDRVGFVIAQADTVQDAIAICDKALEKIEIIVCEG